MRIVFELCICGEFGVYQVCHEAGVLMCMHCVFVGEWSTIVCCVYVSLCVLLMV